MNHRIDPVRASYRFQRAVEIVTRRLESLSSSDDVERVAYALEQLGDALGLLETAFHALPRPVADRVAGLVGELVARVYGAVAIFESDAPIFS